VTLIRNAAVALLATAAAMSLAGCGTAPVPGSPGEQLWFDPAQGQDIHKVSPTLRVNGAIGYPRTDLRAYRAPRPEYIER
jgi:hypothetical protein